MSKRVFRCGLIQCSNPLNDENRPVAEIQKAMVDKHLPMIEEAGKKGVQILCLQEIFNGPYFCPSQDPRWYEAAETIPGPTTEQMQEIANQEAELNHQLSMEQARWSEYSDRLDTLERALPR